MLDPKCWSQLMNRMSLTCDHADYQTIAAMLDSGVVALPEDEVVGPGDDVLTILQRRRLMRCEFDQDL